VSLSLQGPPGPCTLPLVWTLTCFLQHARCKTSINHDALYPCAFVSYHMLLQIPELLLLPFAFLSCCISFGFSMFSWVIFDDLLLTEKVLFMSIMHWSDPVRSAWCAAHVAATVWYYVDCYTMSYQHPALLLLHKCYKGVTKIAHSLKVWLMAGSYAIWLEN